MQLTYHATPKDYWEALDPSEPYVPPDFEAGGFIHCTDGEEALSAVLTEYYGNDPNEWLVLYIDKERVTSPIRYDDPAQMFPHVYGPLNRDAIVAVKPIARTEDGTFLRPEPLQVTR